METNLSKAGEDGLRHFVNDLNVLLRRRTVTTCDKDEVQVKNCGQGSLISPDNIDLEVRAQLSSGTSILLDDDYIRIHTPGGPTTTLPRSTSHLVADLISGRPLGELLVAHKEHLAETLETHANHGERSRKDNGKSWSTWGLAEAFQFSVRSSRNTRFENKAMFEERLSAPEISARRPRYTKEYPLHPLFKLPQASSMPTASFTDVLFRRRTCREYEPRPVSLQSVSNVIFHSCGWTASGTQLVGGMPILRKTSPSPGSMASAEIYLVVLAVDELVRGFYHYSLIEHGLELLDGEDPRNWIVEACGDQEWIVDCSAAILICGIPERLEWKYPVPKGYQAMLMEAGHLSQTALLAATAEGLGCFCTAALREEMFEQRITVQPCEEVPLLVVGLGHMRST